MFTFFKRFTFPFLSRLLHHSPQWPTWHCHGKLISVNVSLEYHQFQPVLRLYVFVLCLLCRDLYVFYFSREVKVGKERNKTKQN